MADAADKAASDDERAMALFEQHRQQRALERATNAEPAGPIDCIDCGEPVSIARQAAWPHTRRCTPCASDIERSRRRAVLT